MDPQLPVFPKDGHADLERLHLATGVVHHVQGEESLALHQVDRRAREFFQYAPQLLGRFVALQGFSFLNSVPFDIVVIPVDIVYNNPQLNTKYTSRFGAFNMASPVLSFRVESELINQLDQLAEATDRDRQYHLKRALTRYVESESWHFRAVAEGIADAEAGNLVDLDAVKAKWVARAENRINQQSGQ